MPGVNEWTLTAEIAEWANEAIRNRPGLPFSKAKVEVRGTRTKQRRDLTVFDRSGKAVLTGEMKMPDSPDGRSPFQESLVMDAHQKADNVGAEYFFTWNVNRCVLWKTFKPGTSIIDRYIQEWVVIAPPARDSEEIEHPRVQDKLRQFLETLLDRSAAYIAGVEAMPTMSLDEKFLRVWDAALEQPVALTLRTLSNRYLADAQLTKELDGWMREEQEWVVSKNEAVVRDNLDRAAKLSCYVLANKIVFYNALRRRFPRMKALKIPDYITSGADLSEHLAGYFAHAAKVSRDYETVFAGDYGDTIPFLNDDSVGGWRDLVQQTDGFDFTQLDYEIIGGVFERLLSAEERHKFGQHYTRSEVVDLINAFCIRNADATVLDPACGGGTFLVRAYARKRDLSGGQIKHQDIIRQLYGVDISAYPAHLTTINLATRDLIDEANYPLVAREDFFRVNPGAAIFHIPMGSGGSQYAALEIDKVDAVVGNPPYIRQEKIGEHHGKKYKDKLRKQADRDAPGADLSGRSDIHCYFFTHGITFLNDGGYLGLLTSSTWLDTTYGFRLQKFLLDNFEIVAVFESSCEPWFTGARVTTAATILRRQTDPAKRAANSVRFVQLTEPLSSLLVYARTEEDRRLTYEELRDRVETAHGTEQFHAALSGGEPVSVGQEVLHGMRIRVVNQGDLYKLGCESVAVSELDESDDDETEQSTPVQSTGSDYIGSKWGIFLRAPDVFFKLLNRGGGAFVPLATPGVASVKRGVTSGCDRFFFPRDVTEEVLAAQPDARKLEDSYGVPARATDRVRIVRAGDGSTHRIEKEFLQPVVFNPMELKSAVVTAAQLSRSVFCVSKPKHELRNTEASKYIRWGEKEGFDDRSTCANRDPWYALSFPKPGDALWSMTQRYRYIVPANPSHLLSNKRLFNINAGPGVDPQVLCAVLNSTISALGRYCYGRLQGGDPVIETEVVDVKMMLIPDPRLASQSVRDRLIAALDSMKRREIGHLVAVDAKGEEPSGDLAMRDRQELDDAVLELLGITDPTERAALRAELYSEITRIYRAIRTAEKRMQGFRSLTARRGRVTPKSLASEIWEGLEEKPALRMLRDFAVDDEADVVELPEGKSAAVNDLFNHNSLHIAGRHIPLGHAERVTFAKALADEGAHGPIRIPIDPAACERALQDYEDYRARVEDQFVTLAGELTADEQMQERTVRELWRLLRKANEPASPSEED